MAVGERIGQLMGTEYGVVTNGCAAALAHITAGCLAGTDQEVQARLPFTDGMPNEVIIQKCHRFGYDYAIKASGGRLVEVETLEEMKAAISENTVMMIFLGDALDNHPGETQVPMPTMAALSNGIFYVCLISHHYFLLSTFAWTKGMSFALHASCRAWDHNGG